VSAELFFCFFFLQVELTDKEFEKMLAVEEKQKKEVKLKKKPKHREHRGSKSRILNRKNDRRSNMAMNISKSDESGDEVDFVAFIAECVGL